MAGAVIAKLAWGVAPIAMGVCIGFGVAVFGLWRWLASSSIATGRDLVASLKRVGIQYLAVGLLLVAVGGNWMRQYFPGHTGLSIIQYALWGFSIGVAVGVRWVCRRGEQ